VVEQPASLIGALNSPHDKSADTRQSLETKPITRGTDGSNPSLSTEESVANPTSSPCRPPVDPARAAAINAPASEPVGSATSGTSSRTALSVTRLIRSDSTLTAKRPVGAPVKAPAV